MKKILVKKNNKKSLESDFWVPVELGIKRKMERSDNDTFDDEIEEHRLSLRFHLMHNIRLTSKSFQFDNSINQINHFKIK